MIADDFGVIVRCFGVVGAEFSAGVSEGRRSRGGVVVFGAASPVGMAAIAHVVSGPRSLLGVTGGVQRRPAG